MSQPWLVSFIRLFYGPSPRTRVRIHRFLEHRCARAVSLPCCLRLLALALTLAMPTSVAMVVAVVEQHRSSPGPRRVASSVRCPAGSLPFPTVLVVIARFGRSRSVDL